MAIYLLPQSLREAWRPVRALALESIWVWRWFGFYYSHNASGMSPLSPCFITIVIITAMTLHCDVDPMWDMENENLYWAVNLLFVLIKESDRATVHPVPSCQLSWLLICSYTVWLVWRKKAEPSASGLPGSYLHYCPLSLLLSLNITLISSSSLIFVSSTRVLSFFFTILHYLSLNLMF